MRFGSLLTKHPYVYRLIGPLGLIAMVALAASACGDGTEPTATATQQSQASVTPQTTRPPDATATAMPTDIKIAASSLPRASADDAPEADVDELAQGNTQFALALYKQLRDEDGNLFYSPFSISLALAMTYAGARGETEQQMADALNFTLPQDRLHPAFNALDQELESRGENTPEEEGTAFQFSIANALWGQQGFEFLNEYLDTLAVNYGAGMRLVDFIGATEESRQIINEWVAGETEDHIQDLLPEGVITDMTRLVLTNAIYFKASWVHQFNEANTSPGDFHLLDGSTVSVPMMKQSARTLYGEGDGWQALELPYVGHQTSMVLVLPADGEFQDFEAGLDAAQLGEILGELGDAQVNMTVPKFEFESALGLSDTLKAMGMPVAFTDDADFSGMNGERGLVIHDVVHKAFVKVDEEGTEAAAATGVVVGPTSMPQPAEITLDRPFIFLIRDRATDTVLFMGRVLDPGG